MHVERYLQDHRHIAQQIAAMRSLSRDGIPAHAHDIAEQLATMAAQIKLHLALEDQVLYPELARVADTALAALATRYQGEMAALTEAFAEFVAHWRVAAHIEADPEGFRHAANVVLKALHERLQREEAEFFPAVARL
ncbi:MAG TPA: hemerythrin domain-containing protein [Rhodanobacter sp.]|nr:hemerythrin domain-containing protein [Rhodanobacter sp.]